MMSALVALATLLGSSLVIIQFLWRRLRLWKRIAEESQASSTYWYRKYQEKISPDFSARIGQRSPVSVLREGPSTWFDLEREARGGYR